MSVFRLKNILLSKVLSRYPSLAKKFITSFKPLEFDDVPWSSSIPSLKSATVAMVTTAGVHHKDQKPFDMNDRDGDPSFRELDVTRPLSTLMITHDYYDHSDADKDINVVFPIERLREFEKEGMIGKVADTHYGFMGHIVNRHIPSLMDTYAPRVARNLQEDGVNLVLLTPG